jgi:excisionase family DNA binding protein
MSEFPEILTLEQAAAFLQISTRTIQRLVRDGQMPGSQIGSQWRFEREQLRQWVRGELGPEGTVRAQSELTEQERKRFGTDMPETLIELQQQAVRRLAASLDERAED